MKPLIDFEWSVFYTAICQKGWKQKLANKKAGYGVIILTLQSKPFLGKFRLLTRQAELETKQGIPSSIMIGAILDARTVLASKKLGIPEHEVKAIRLMLIGLVHDYVYDRVHNPKGKYIHPWVKKGWASCPSSNQAQYIGWLQKSIHQGATLTRAPAFDGQGYESAHIQTELPEEMYASAYTYIQEANFAPVPGACEPQAILHLLNQIQADGVLDLIQEIEDYITPQIIAIRYALGDGRQKWSFLAPFLQN